VNGCVERGAKVISMSLGGGGSSNAARDAYHQIYKDGVLIIAAAGNGGNTGLSYPASYPAIMSVAAVDSNQLKAGFSQWNEQVEIAAPGVGVKSTITKNQGNSFSYATWSGTSMATPHVAGVAALVWSHFPNCTNSQIRNALLKSARRPTAMGAANCDVKYGHGIVDGQATYENLIAFGCAFGLEHNPDPKGGCEQTGVLPTPAPTPAPTFAECACDLRVEVKFDSYAEETSWKLFNKDSNTKIAEMPVGSGTKHTVKLHQECLGPGSPGEQVFTMYDGYGDGLCCKYGEGYFKVSMNGVDVVVSKNKSEGGQDFKNVSYTIPACETVGNPTPMAAPMPVPVAPPMAAPMPMPVAPPVPLPTPGPTIAPTSAPVAPPMAWPTPAPVAPPMAAATPAPTPEVVEGPPGPPGPAGPPGPPGTGASNEVINKALKFLKAALKGQR